MDACICDDQIRVAGISDSLNVAHVSMGSPDSALLALHEKCNEPLLLATVCSILAILYCVKVGMEPRASYVQANVLPRSCIPSTSGGIP